MSAAPVANAIPSSPSATQIGATLRLRVGFGGLPPQDMAAALLQPQEIPDRSLAGGRARFVLALVKDWREAQLRSPTARLFVQRNKVGPGGETTTISTAARLVQFDATTGLGLFAYLEDFDSDMDVGFRLPHGQTADANLVSLCTGLNPEVPRPAAEAPRGRHGQTFSVESRLYPAIVRPTGHDTPPAPAAPVNPVDTVRLVVDASNRLVGFATSTPDSVEFSPANDFRVALQVPTLEPSNVTFESLGGGDSQVRLILALASPENDGSLQRVRLRQRELGPDENPPSSDGATSTYAPISGNVMALSPASGPAGSWSASLTLPPVGQQRRYLVQLTWPLLPQPGSPEVQGRPFVVKVVRQTDGLYPSVTGLPGVTQPTESPPSTATPFALEGIAQEVHLMAGGREALIRLDRTPLWKRFSFEKNDWLPLPAIQGDVVVTGNLNALFVLDKATREVRKFRLPGLEPAGIVKLPPAEYFTIQAGANSAHAPVHVLAEGEALALDPDTLQRRDFPRRKDNPDRWFTVGNGQEPIEYSVTGDGLSIWRLDKNFQRLFSYNDDEHGLDRSYFGTSEQATGGLAGVTGGFRVSGGLFCTDTPGGQSVDQGQPPGLWPYTTAALAENAPVVFRLLRPRSNAVPPPPPRLGCFAFSSNVPFVEIDVPELGPLIDQTAFRKERWAFLDPYSRQIATLGADRKTWYVRRLVPEGQTLPPVLLNWPDTSVDLGGRFAFQPQFSTPVKFTAAVHGRPDRPVTVDDAANTLELPLAAEDFDSLHLLDLLLDRPNEEPLVYPILVHAVGPTQPFIIPAGKKVANINQQGRGLLSVGMPLDKSFRPLPATFLRLPEPVLDIQGVVAGCAVLRRADNHLDFLNLQTRQFVGTLTGPPGAWYYLGAGALLEYDPGKRTIARISVPDGKYEQVVPLPPSLALCGVGVGTDPGSPVTLAFEAIQQQSRFQFADLIWTNTLFRSMCMVLDGRTLRARGITQPVPLWQFLGQKEGNGQWATAGFAGNGVKPVVLPASRTGALVYLQQYFVALGLNYAVAYPFGEGTFSMQMSFAEAAKLSAGSASGLMAFSGSGQAYKGGITVVDPGSGGRELGSTPGGSYQLSWPSATAGEAGLDIRLAETGKPLLRLARLAFMEDAFTAMNGQTGRRIAMLGDNGPLAILSPTGRTLELVSLNISSETRNVSPKDFHVVSQPVPLVMEGQMAQYQVRVNNPESVQSYRLQRETPGATVMANGSLSYRAPSGITGPTRTTISIEIKGKDGRTVLHEFPIYVLPTMRASAKLGGTGI